jgi:cytochrome c2
MRSLLLILFFAAPVFAQGGWRTTLTKLDGGETVQFTSQNAAFRLGEGETLHPEVHAQNLSVEYEALLVLLGDGIQRITLEVEGGVGSLELIDPRDPTRRVSIDITEERGAPLALPGSDLPEILIRVSFKRRGKQAARLRTLWDARLADGSWHDFEPIPAWAAQEPPLAGPAAGDEAFLGRVLLEVKGCTSCHKPGAQGSFAVGESRSPEDYRALVDASWLWKNPLPLAAENLRWLEEGELLNSSPPLATLVPGRGCLDPEDLRTPRFTLNEEERAALSAGIESAKRVVGDHAPLDAGRRRYEVLGCTNCHSMNSSERVSLGRKLGTNDGGAPDLGDAGWRLKESWIADILTEKVKPHRPDLSYKGRMPSFPHELALPIASFLAASAGTPRGEAQIPAEELALLASAGRDLAATDRMACISCHSLGERIPNTLGPFKLERFPDRLRREWFEAFVISPARLRPETSMSGLNDGGEGIVHDVLQGDLARQAEALWVWCEHALELAAPVGTLTPLRGAIGTEPVVLKAEFDGRALRCVGTTEGLHLGWDAETGQLIEAWLNPFIALDEGEAELRGAIVWSAPDGPSLVAGTRPDEWPSSPETGAHEFSRSISGDWGASRRKGSLAMHETATGRIVPELVILRSIELSEVDPTQSYWFRPGPGVLKIESVTGCDALKHLAPAGEAPWIELVPHPGQSECSLRVTLRP